jgi:hypothetical protein
LPRAPEGSPRNDIDAASLKEEIATPAFGELAITDYCVKDEIAVLPFLASLIFFEIKKEAKRYETSSLRQSKEIEVPLKIL